MSDRTRAKAPPPRRGALAHTIELDAAPGWLKCQVGGADLGDDRATKTLSQFGSEVRSSGICQLSGSYAHAKRVVLFHEGVPVAAAVVEEGLGVLHVPLLAVEPELHGQGFGSMMFAALLAHAEHSGVEHLVVSVTPNSPASRWWQRVHGLGPLPTHLKNKMRQSSEFARTANEFVPEGPARCRKSRKRRAPPPQPPRRHRGGHDGTQPRATGRRSAPTTRRTRHTRRTRPSSHSPLLFPPPLPSTAVLGRDARQEQRVHRRQAAGRQPGRPVNVGQLRGRGRRPVHP